MLGVKSYTQDYVDACRHRVATQLNVYRALTKTAEADAIATFEPIFLANMVLVLDACFTHRLRTLEGKDGNPLNEVRVLCNSLLTNGGVVAADKSIRMNPETSILGLHLGDEITLRETQFIELSDAFFTEIEKKYA